MLVCLCVCGGLCGLCDESSDMLESANRILRECRLNRLTIARSDCLQGVCSLQSIRFLFFAGYVLLEDTTRMTPFGMAV